MLTLNVQERVNELNDCISKCNDTDVTNEDIGDVISIQHDLITDLLETVEELTEIHKNNLKFVFDLTKIIENGQSSSDGNTIATFTERQIKDLKQIVLDSLKLRTK